MTISHLSGRVVLITTDLLDTTTSPATYVTWLASFSFTDNSGTYLGTDVALGDIISLSTSSVDLGTITSYKIVEVISSAFNQFRARIEYLLTNTNPAGPPDLVLCGDVPGAIARSSTRLGISTLVDSSIQQLPTAFVNKAIIDNFLNVVDSITVASDVATPSTLVVRNASGGFSTTQLTAVDLTTTNLTFGGTGPVTIASSNDINLSAVGMITLDTVLQLPTRTKIQLTAITSVPAGTIAFCADTGSGAMPVYFNGTSWLKIFDNGAI